METPKNRKRRKNEKLSAPVKIPSPRKGKMKKKKTKRRIKESENRSKKRTTKKEREPDTKNVTRCLCCGKFKSNQITSGAMNTHATHNRAWANNSRQSHTDTCRLSSRRRSQIGWFCRRYNLRARWLPSCSSSPRTRNPHPPSFPHPLPSRPSSANRDLVISTNNLT